MSFTSLAEAMTFVKTLKYSTIVLSENRRSLPFNAAFILATSSRASGLSSEARDNVRHYVTERGLFARVARKLKLDASYVSRVANGERRNERISQALDAALDKMCNVRRKAISSLP